MRGLLALATVGIAIALALITLLGVVDSGNQTFVWLENMGGGADIFQSVITAVALVVGGIFGWYRFIRSERDPRLQPDVDGKAVIHNGTIYVVATVTAHNTGMVAVPLGGASAIEIYATGAGDNVWSYVDIKEVFIGHNNIQPGETLEDQVWLEVPQNNRVGIKLDLTVVPGTGWTYPITTIIGLIQKDHSYFTEDG